MGSIRRKTHGALQQCTAKGVSNSVGRWMKCHRRFNMQALTYCDAKVMSTRTATGQFKVSSRGRWMKVQGRFKMQALTYCDAIVMSTRITAGQFKGQFMGAMDEMSRKVQSAKAHSNLRTRKAALRQFSGARERYMRGFDSAQNSRGPATIHRQQ